MKNAILLLIVALLVFGCADKHGNRDEEAVARKLFDALRDRNADTFSACIVTAEDVEYVMTFFSMNSDEYQALTLEEKHEFERLFQGRVEEMQREWQSGFESMIEQVEALWESEDIEWEDIRYDGFESAFGDFEIAYMPRYGEFNILFHHGDRKYRLRTDGTVKIHDRWKLQLGEITLEAIDDTA